MAGTRLLLQVISVFQIVCLAIWSFYFGFCGVNEDGGNNNQRDLLCTKLLDAVFPPSTTLDHQQKQQNNCLPPPKKSVLLPTAQVSTPLSSNNNIVSWEINKEAESVCQKEQVDINNPNQSNHPLWLCSHLQEGEQHSSKKLRLVNQDSTLIVYYANENDLFKSETLFPSNLKLPQIFNVRLFLEEQEVTHDDGDDDNDNDITANYYNSWMSIVDYWMTYQAKFLNVNTGIFSDDYWPCLEDIHIDVQFISTSNTRNWATQTITSNPAAVDEDEKEAVTQEEEESEQLVEEVEEDQVEEHEEQERPDTITATFLDKPTKKQIKSLLADLPTMDSETLSSSSSSLPLTLVVYIPSILPQETFTYTTTAAAKNGVKVNEQQQLLILPSSSESLAEILSTYTTRWIASILMGVPQTMEVDDGTFPTWYTTYYHHFLIDHYFQQQEQQQQDDNECVDIESNSIDTKINTSDNNELLGDLLFRYTTAKKQKQKPESFERHFPIEHYAAIFAPLLFPLLVPQLAGIIREWKRYKEKTKKKASLTTSTTIKGGDENTLT